MRLTRIKYGIFAICLTAFAAVACGGNDDEPDVPEADEVKFVAQTWQSGDVKIGLQQAVVNASATGKTALVLYMHGGSSKGDDNLAPMREAGVGVICDYLKRNGIKAVFVVPQCPKDMSWGGTMNQVLKELIDHYIASGQADAGMTYAFGGSMGGTGLWSLLSAYPGLIKAAMPVAGNPARCVPENVAKTKVYAVMGTDDAIMNEQTVIDFVEQIIAAGGAAKVDVEQGWTHETTCTQSYTDTRLGWVFG